ncbi:D-2-hydroxyacid dehydrogenase family protein [Chitinophaga sp. Cy-1792]|uniref:D-2-hydroxyacid dehydrogenase family protein n=1 Tax=Chitinophaga sp. Cy-1792 TaxID=2608339 RepID=UPI00141DFA32|nr:D-2-hydroxyacid dehydrogenase family protein [Chitinophaga sp. Cy-1792]NIG55626.1 D-2-hydroxyacid dehydrogenase family protein [Chitinophaga sp. Cy-1792]
MRIAILDDYQNAVKDLDCFKLLAGHEVTVLTTTEKDPALLAAKLQGIEVLVLIRARTKVGVALLDRLPDLKLISQTGRSSGHVDLAACTAHNVAVAEGISSPVAPAELTWALIMNAVRQIPKVIEDFKLGRWQTNIGNTIDGKIIGIWGYGKIGKLVAGYAHAFGAKVLVWGSEGSRQSAVQDGFERAATKEEFFRTADVVSLQLQLNKDTAGIVTESDLMQMKPTAVIVNTSRAGLIAPGALLKSLQAGHPGFAAIDVFEEEPIYDINYPLLKMPNVVCTPHIGYVEKSSYELYFSIAFENILHYASGKPTNIANPEVLG